jgi:class 3 adenylate cyclase
MSQGVVDRTVARAIAILILMAGILVALGALVAVWMAGVLTKPIRLLTQGVQAIAGGDFHMRMTINRSDEIGDLTDAFNQMAKGLAERELMRGAFSTYVSKDLLAEIIKNPDAMKLGGSRKEGTVMFTFFGNHHELPALMSRLDPEAFVRIINDYLELQARLVFEHKGHLDKFVGEEVVAVWGATTPVEDHAVWAIKCALAIEAEVEELNKRRERQGLMTTRISVGINSGSMVAGNMGSQDGKRDYTVISADVNFAARLAGAGAIVHGGEIWLGENTYELVRDSVQLREKREVAFKGIPEPRPVYIVAGLKSPAPRDGL